MPMVRELRLLYYFAEIARAGSIRGAAARIGVSPAAPSAALAELEARMGLSLITRTTRRLRLTDIGRQVAAEAEALVGAADRALALGRPEARLDGRVRVTLPVELAAGWLTPRLRRFEDAHPAVRVEVDADDRMVDLGASAFDVAVRAVHRDAPRRGEPAIPVELVAAPARLAAAPAALPERVAALGLVGGAPGAARGEARFQAIPRAGGPAVTLTAPRRICVNSQLVAQELAKAGFGAALLLAPQAAADLETGALARVDPAYRFGEVSVTVALRDPQPAPAARALAEALRAAP